MTVADDTDMSDDLDPFGDPFPEASDGSTTVGRNGPVSGGSRKPIPAANPLPPWRSATLQDAGDGVDGTEIDYTDLNSINHELQTLRVRMNKIRRQMRSASREAVEAKLTYQRALRRALVQQSGGSAETRKAHAELLCEDLEAASVMAAQVADEYLTLFRNARDDVENAKTVAYNLRALMNLA